MARKTEKVENLEMSTVGREYGKKTENRKNEKHPLDDLKMTQITKKTKNEKCNTEGPGIWRKKLKITENEKYNNFQDGNMAARKN